MRYHQLHDEMKGVFGRECTMLTVKSSPHLIGRLRRARERTLL